MVISKIFPNDADRLKLSKPGIPAYSHEGETGRSIKKAAEQLADLLWRCWQARNTTRNNTKRDKRAKSGSRLDSPRSSRALIKPQNFRQLSLY